MTQYNTGNPVPSSAMPDVWDNNATIDEFVNSPELTLTTRTGTERDTLAGIQKKSDDQRVQMAEDGAAVVEETRQNLIPLSRQYMTLDAAQADIANIPDGSTTYVRSPDGGTLADEYINNGGTLAATGRAMPSKESFDTLIETNQQTLPFTYLLSAYNGDSTYPLALSADNNIVLGYDAPSEAIRGLDVQSALQYLSDMSGLGFSRFKGSPSGIIPIIGGSDNNIVLGYDTVKAKLVGLFPESAMDGSPRALPFKVAKVATNFILAYGQSLSTGVRAQSVISLTQPYSNITFSSGVRGNGGDFSAIKPLIEDDAKPTPDGESSAAETVCSGTANYASLAMYRENSILPSDHVIFCSTAGHGAYTIAQLAKGSAWYNSQFLNHLNGAKNLNHDIALHAIAWLQGETDSNNTSYTKSAHLAALLKLQSDITTDAQAVTGQDSPVMFLTYQHSSRVKTNDAVPLAILEACETSDYFYFVAPTYAFPHYTDGLHLLAEGYKWIGAYYGRAYKQAVIDGIKPLAIMPKGATWHGNKITVRFDVPVPPLVLDTTNLAPTATHGFAVSVGGIAQAITLVEVLNGDSVVITLSSALASAPQVRYAFDNLGAGLTIQNGASGNLRDSCPDTCIIAGNEKPMFYLCPHFKLNAISEEF
ncbi:TPA: sialate O-acetylesterase [Klebsiella pneumoniae]